MDFEEFCVLMQKKIAQEAQSEVLELFSIWDVSGEGIIESGELKCLLNRVPIRLTRREIDLLVDHADTKKNGKINFEGVLYIETPTITIRRQSRCPVYSPFQQMLYCSLIC